MLKNDKNNRINFILGLLNSVKSLLGFGRSNQDKEIKSDLDIEISRNRSTNFDVNKPLSSSKSFGGTKEEKPNFPIEETLSEKKDSMIPQNKFLKVEKASNQIVPIEILKRFELYPENRRRPVNKTIFTNQYFQLTLNTKDNSLTISSKGDLVYSAIPYDTARNYLQRAAIQSILHPINTRNYLIQHKPTLERYLALSIYQVTGEKVQRDSSKVQQAYNQILEDPLFAMQVLGRLLQHDETGPLSANLAGKFLYSENLKTGISAYLSEYLKFVIEVTHSLQIETDGRNVQVMERDYNQMADELRGGTYLVLNKASDIANGVERLPEILRQDIMTLTELNTAPLLGQPILQSVVGRELANNRKQYVAHSKPPKELEKYFENVLTSENTHQVNVLSDIHTTKGKLPFKNVNFNILVGDLSDSQVSDFEIKGIYIIGNHELSGILSNPQINSHSKWDNYRRTQWFSELIKDPDESWSKLPVGNNGFYELIKEELAKHFPKMTVLNNEATTHDGIRYIGLTIPVALVKRKAALQTFIFTSLARLLADDINVPTVIVSHAPLFNELSMLSPKNRAYNKDYFCSDSRIEHLFSQYNIIGAIHGHHHIPASFGRYKKVLYAGKELFVVCSIYSNINTGFELMDLLPSESK